MSAKTMSGARALRVFALSAVLVAGHAVIGSPPAQAAPVTTPALDADFGTGGRVQYALAGSNTRPDAVALDAVGRLVVGGNAGANAFIARYSTNGQLDTTFGDNGIVTTTTPVSDLKIDGSGRIVTASSGSSGIVVARYDANGTPDPAFSGDGVVNLPTESWTQHRVVVAANGDITVIGSSYRSPLDVIAAVRYTSAGELDTSFGAGDAAHPGVAVAALAGNNLSAADAVLDASGRLVVVGMAVSRTTSNIRYAVVRFSALGVPDTSFGSGGFATDWSTGIRTDARSVLLDSSGRLLVSGMVVLPDNVEAFVVVRYSQSGAVDTTYGTSGAAVGSGDQVQQQTPVSMALDAAGRVIVVGYDRNEANAVFRRLQPGGAVDTTFGANGYYVDVPAYSPTASALDSSGRLVVASENWYVSPTTSEYSRFVLPAGPAAPTGVAAVGSSDALGSLDVSWTPPAADADWPVTGYTALAAPGGQSCTANTSAATSCSISGLAAGTAHTVTVTAETAQGTGASSAPSAAATALGLPGAPSNLVASPAGDQIAVTWAVPANTGGRPVTSYDVTTSPASAGCPSTSATSCTITGLGAGTYSVNVTATTSIGTGPAAVQSVVIAAPAPPPVVVPPPAPVVETPPAPPVETPVVPAPVVDVTDVTPPLAPATLVATGRTAAGGSVGAVLSWTLPGGNDVASVRVAAAVGTAVPAAAQAWPGSTQTMTTATLSGLRAGATYTIAVYAVDAAGNLSAPTAVKLDGAAGRISVPLTSTAAAAVTVRGTLRNARGILAKRPVELLARPSGAGAWRLLARTSTDVRGNVAVVVRPKVSTQYAIRYAGERGQLGTTVASRLVGVRSVVAARIAVKTGAISATAVRTRAVVTLAGTVSPGKATQRVHLQVLVGRVWRNVSVTALNRTGGYSFVLPTAARGVHRYRVYRPADRVNIASYSAPTVLTVV